MRASSFAFLVAASVLAGIPAARAGTATALCRPGQDDAAERDPPADLLPALSRLFGIPKDALRRASFIRCSAGTLLACAVGANLNCGRADTSRRSPGATAFCRDDPGADSVPLAATGHDTVYTWRCAGRRAVAGGPVTPTDRLGFIKNNWVRVP